MPTTGSRETQLANLQCKTSEQPTSIVCPVKGGLAATVVASTTISRVWGCEGGGFVPPFIQGGSLIAVDLWMNPETAMLVSRQH